MLEAGTRQKLTPLYVDEDGKCISPHAIFAFGEEVMEW